MKQFKTKLLKSKVALGAALLALTLAAPTWSAPDDPDRTVTKSDDLLIEAARQKLAIDETAKQHKATFIRLKQDRDVGQIEDRIADKSTPTASSTTGIQAEMDLLFTDDMFSLAMLQEDGDQDSASALKDAAPAEEYNDGQDPTRPLWRVDLRYRYQQTSSNTDVHLGTFRIDMPVALDEEKGIPGGAIYTRIDIPFAYTNQVGTDNPNGDYEFELTDSLMQNIYLPEFAWVKKNTPFDAIAIGVQWGFPSGTGDFVSREKFAIAPVFGWKWDLDGPNTFIAPIWRFRSSFGDIDNGKNRDDVSELTLQPYLNISTKDWGWPIDFITFYETQEIKLNFEDGTTKESGDWFIPFEMEVGKMLAPGVVGSIDFGFPIYKSDGFDAYDWFVEFRIGFFF